MTALLRPGSLAAAAVLLASACTCSRSPATRAGLGDTGHVIHDAAGGASDASDAAGGTRGGSGGGSGTSGAGTAGAYTGPTGLLACASLPPSSEPVPNGWPAGAKRLPALDPDVYVFEVPPDPAPLTWKACGTGCLELVNTWATGLSDPLYANTKGGLVSSTPWLMLKRRYATRLQTWVGPVEGGAVRMLDEQIEGAKEDHGFSSPVGVHGAGYVVTVYNAPGSASANWVLSATPSGQALHCVFSEKTTADRTQVFFELATSTDRWALRSDIGPIVTGTLPLDEPMPALPSLISPPAGWSWTSGLAGLSHALVLAAYRPVQTVAYSWAPGAGLISLTGTSASSETDGAVASDGSRIAWEHGSGLTVDAQSVARWSKIELMVATDTGSYPVSGNSVGQLPTLYAWTPLLLRGDYVAGWASMDASLKPELLPYVLRLSDRRFWTIHNRSPDVYWDRVLYVSDTEVALLEKTRKTFASYFRTIVRYRLDSLGAGQPLDAVIDGGVP